MSKAKTSTIFNIIGNGIKVYTINLFNLSTPVILPVLAILLGIGLMIIPAYILPKYYETWATNLPVLKELYSIITVIVLSMLPGLILFKIGFWNYMLRFVSLNSMVGDILKKKVLKNHDYYAQIVALRAKDYFLMLAIFCSIWLMGLALPFSIYLFNIEPLLIPYILIGLEFVAVFLLLILSIYLSLCFQVFAFETSFGPMQTLEESFKLVLNNFWRLLTLAITLTMITSVLIPQIFGFIADILLIKTTIALPIESFLTGIYNNSPQIFDMLQNIPTLATQATEPEKLIEELSKVLSFSLIASIISLLMLPLGSCLYTIFYFDAKKRYTAREISEQENREPEEKKTKKSTKAKTKKK